MPLVSVCNSSVVMTVLHLYLQSLFRVKDSKAAGAEDSSEVPVAAECGEGAGS